MLDELEAPAVVDEGVAGNARGHVVGLGETSVDDHQLAVCPDGRLAFGYVHGYMAVDDVPLLAFHTEGIKDGVDDCGVVAQVVVMSFLFGVRGLVFDEVTLKGGHLVLVEER